MNLQVTVYWTSGACLCTRLLWKKKKDETEHFVQGNSVTVSIHKVYFQRINMTILSFLKAKGIK